MADKINDDMNNGNFDQYLLTPTHLSCHFEKVNEDDVLKIKNKLNNKSSSGKFGISNKILKYMKYEVSKSLTLIINQMLVTGIFLKSKIIPLYKKGDASELSNYR